jgi:DNA-binding GntR family transcriptional regulator
MSSPSTIPFNQSIPLYHQIALTLRARAEAGGLGQNGGLATEQQLCAEFGVSRTTIRQALGMLKQDGLLQSRRGVGTRLMPHTPPRRLTSAAGDPLHAGLGTTVHVVSIEPAEPPAEVRKFLTPDERSPDQRDPDRRSIVRLVRTHTLDDVPLSVVVTYLPAQYAVGITARTLRLSLHELLWRRHGLLQKRSVHCIGVARADTMVASLLGVGIADPVLHVQSSAYLDDGRPIRWTDNYFREGRFAYQAEIAWKKPAGGRPPRNPESSR